VIRRALFRGPRNLGIDAGKSGLLVVDEDRPSAFGAYAGSADQVVPVTFTVSTGRGRHFYFRQPAVDPAGNSRGRLRDCGVDVKGLGGCVTGPGSVHASGTIYMPLDAWVPVAAAPDWLLAAVRWTPPAPDLGTVRPGRPESAFRRLQGVLAVVLSARAPVGDEPGERNSSLYWASCRTAEMIAAGEVDRAAAVDALSRAGCAVGLVHGDVQATIASALRRVAA